MTRRAALLFAAAAGSTLAGASPSPARDFVAYASTSPILYRYAACVFEGDAKSAERQISLCAPLKAELELESAAVIERFHASTTRNVELEFQRGLREIDREAELTRSRNRPVPSAIVGYLKCMGEGAMNHPDFINGVAVSYIGVEETCADAMQALAEQSDVTKAEARSIDSLYRRFKLTRRVPYSRLRSGRLRSSSRAASPPVWLMDGGFINVALVREADDD